MTTLADLRKLALQLAEMETEFNSALANKTDMDNLDGLSHACNLLGRELASATRAYFAAEAADLAILRQHFRPAEITTVWANQASQGWDVIPLRERGWIERVVGGPGFPYRLTRAGEIVWYEAERTTDE